MLVYWSIVLLPALLSLAQRPRQTRKSQALPLLLLFVTLFFFLALRETGGDYPTYVRLYEIVQYEDLASALGRVEPVYALLNWLSGQFDLGIYAVNAACALVFLGCLYRAALRERNPFLFLTLAVPYFVIVVGMGYTRQGVAAALILMAIVHMREGHLGRAVLSILLAAGFHYSAFAALALPLFSATKDQRGAKLFAARVLLVVLLVLSTRYFFSDQIDTYAEHYIVSDRYESGGAFLRSLVTAAAAFVFFLMRRPFQKAYPDYLLWRPFAALGILSLPLSLAASTAVDRVGLYLIPFQLIVFSRLPALINHGRSFTLVKLAVIFAYLGYFFVWLHLGNYADELWLPYRWIFSGPE